MLDELDVLEPLEEDGALELERESECSLEDEMLELLLLIRPPIHRVSPPCYGWQTKTLWATDPPLSHGSSIMSKTIKAVRPGRGA